MSIELVTFLMFGGLISCLLLGVPLAWSLGGVAVIVSYLNWGFGGMMLIVYNTFGSMWSIVLVAIQHSNNLKCDINHPMNNK